METNHITFQTPAFLDRENLIICVKCAPTETGVLIPYIYEYNSETDAFHSFCDTCHKPMNEI